MCEYSNSFFVISVAFLSFGLEEPQTLCYGTGFAVGLFGLAEVGLYLKYPEIFEIPIEGL